MEGGDVVIVCVEGGGGVWMGWCCDCVCGRG